MKKFNKNIIVFISVSLFLIIGLFESGLYIGIYESFYIFSDNEIPNDMKIEKFIDEIENAYTEKLSYHNAMLDLNSLVLNETGTDYVKKDSDIVVKASNDYLTYSVSKMDDEIITKYTDNISGLYEYTKANNIPFLYVMAPQKGYGFDYPAGTENYIKDNCTSFLKNLSDKGVPYLEIRQAMEDEGISEEEGFFITDHHWTPKTAFWATSRICQELDSLYGFDYDKSIFDLNNYNVKTYEDWFLGSQGKKVGKYFTDLGVDDIDLITPKFDTNLVVSQPLKNDTKIGSFEETILQLNQIENKNYHKLNPYTVYTGGDFHIQTIENLNNTEGKNILVIRDSYACASTPFLSLTGHNTHILDIREMSGMYGDRVQSVSKYIEEMQADYVIILYNGVFKDDAKYTFEK